MFGCSGSGKTELYLPTAAACEGGGGGCVYADSRVRFADITNHQDSGGDGGHQAVGGGQHHLPLDEPGGE